MALPEDHLAKFHKMADVKKMWEAIKSRFGGNDESKKMQKYLLKQQFEGFSVSALEGLHKGCDRFQTLLSQLEIHGAGVSHEDANKKFLRVFESDMKGTTASSSNTQNVTFVSTENTSSTNDINDDDMEEMDLKWKVAMISMRIKKFHKSTCRKLQFDTKDPDIDCSGHAEEDVQNYAMMAYSSNNLGSNNEVNSCSKACEESYARLKKLYDDQRDKLGDASVEITAYTLALKR
uniref:Ribonuclease H-like domain-containing protein n=1 Tax=Tanacetum cinerariifolium TaxID=118510 RepID=A0A6L2LXU6_TANCI|nr:ribonuclease H-like domain-containing protein [Tanacetum cinerariifolium]